MPPTLETLLRRISQETRCAAEARDPRASASHAALATAYRAQVQGLFRAERTQTIDDALSALPARYRRGFAVLHGVRPGQTGFLADAGA